jgi:hypothetical protein
MEDHKLRVFCAVADTKCFSKASELIHLTQPAVSLQVQAMEELYETRLFDRSGNSINLTPAGEILYKRAKEILALYAEAQKNISEITGAIKGSLSIGASSTIGNYLLPTIISAFNSLTLSPALCALMLRPRGAEKDRFARLWDLLLGWFFRLFNRAFAFSAHAYSHGVQQAIRFAVVVLVGYVGLLLVTGMMFSVVPTGFVPESDQAYTITAIQLPEGASLERTDAEMHDAVVAIVTRRGDVEG